MKKLIIPYILLILLTTPLAVADSSLTMDVTISESLNVVFNFTNIEPKLYGEIRQGFNVSIIPDAVEEKISQQNLTNAKVICDLNQQIFNDETSSIYVEFLLAGSDIVSYTLNETDMTRIFLVRTEWRKFQVSFTQNFSLNFEEYFGAPLTEWNQVNNRVFERRIEVPFEMSFRFTLPEKAFDVQAEEDTIIFKIPRVFEDTLLNSPFLILGALIIANIAALVYRKVRK